MTDGSEAARPAQPGRARRRPGVLSVLGEILVTVGVLLLLFVAWQLWIGDWIDAAEKNAAGHSLSAQWAHERQQVPPASTPAAPGASPSPGATSNPAAAAPPPMPQPRDGQVFGVMFVPRFGSDYAVPMAGGVTRARTLDPIGIGHYPHTPMPGAVGNVALAAHRTTFGKPFNLIATLRAGDPIVIETRAGWYTYRFRNLEYVKPDAIDVLLPVPQQPGMSADGRYLTMTSCSPMWYKTERIVAYSVFDSFTPAAAGRPAALTGGT